MKYYVWIKEEGRWETTGEGPFSLKTAERIAKEIRQDCRVPAIVKPVGLEPKQPVEVESSGRAGSSQWAIGR